MERLRGPAGEQLVDLLGAWRDLRPRVLGARLVSPRLPHRGPSGGIARHLTQTSRQFVRVAGCKKQSCLPFGHQTLQTTDA